jgi:hypothetical protein
MRRRFKLPKLSSSDACSARRNVRCAKRFISVRTYDVGESVFAPDPAEAMDFTGLEDPDEVLEGRRETSFHG